MSMALSDMMRLASQAEKEGVTLAEKISRCLSPEEIVRMQDDLETELASNYRNIEEFMGGIEVPSIDDMMSLGDEELLDLLGENVPASSDETAAE
ncbi:MAG: hypothetical protein A3K67_03050 [Euryarchaeota archaeon RBG_16_62_10]|nr:MAG: hypothetical protein A3K67_03050 [Euryarchaeota archaeon RBG_16_62_10]